MQRTPRLAPFSSAILRVSLVLWMFLIPWAVPATAGTILPAGPEFRANVAPLDHQLQAWASVAVAADGRFLVVWVRYTPFTAFVALEARLFDAGGAPRSGTIRFANPGSLSVPPRVVAAPGGGFAVAWAELESGIHLRLLDSDGQPLGGESSFFPGALACCLDLAPLPEGGFVAAWIGGQEAHVTPIGESTGVQARRLDSQGRPVGEIVEVLEIDRGSRRSPRVAADAQGGFAVTWEEEGRIASTSTFEAWVRRFDTAGAPLGPPVRVPPAGEAFQLGPVPVFGRGGVLSVVWAEWRLGGGGPGRMYVQEVNAVQGHVGERIELPVLLPASPTPERPEVVADAFGNRAVLWSGPSEDDPDAALAQLFDASWQPRSGPFQLNDFELAGQKDPRAAFTPEGQIVAVWTSRSQATPAAGVAGRLFTPSCPTGAGAACLGGRFLAEISWRAPGGTTGAGRPLPLASDTGAFWFFDRNNPELLVKVLDGRSVNGHFWVFFGALTNVEYDLTVTDTETGARKTWRNPAGTLASRADIRAFPAAGSAPAPAAALASLASIAPDGTTPRPGGAEVSVEWRDPATGELRSAGVEPLSRDSAYFWFFGKENAELLVKVLDGRPVNGHVWVFFGGLTNLEYTLTVTLDGETRTYHNPRGRMASAADTQAF